MLSLKPIPRIFPNAIHVKIDTRIRSDQRSTMAIVFPTIPIKCSPKRAIGLVMRVKIVYRSIRKRKRRREEGLEERQWPEYNLNNMAFLRSNRTVQSDSNDPLFLFVGIHGLYACARDNCSNQIHADCVGDAIKILFAQSACRACGHSNRSHLFAGKRNVCLYRFAPELYRCMHILRFELLL